MKTLRVGIIGLGFIGKVHAYGYLTSPLFYEKLGVRGRITHVCTSRPETAEAGRAQLDAEVAVTDYRAVTENPDIDIVNICTPNHLHKDALLSAMRHQKHIYCDKPLVVNMREAEEVLAALPSYRGTAQMTLQCRFFPPVMRAKQLIDEGFVGKVLEFRAVYLHAGSANPNAPLRWKLSAEAGGGVINDLASHVLDLMHHLLGDYAGITANTHVAYAERPSAADPKRMLHVDAEDCVMMLVRMADGSLGHIEATKIATGTEDEIRFEIHGEKGALRFNSMEPHFLEAFDATAAAAPIGGMQGWTRIATGQRYPAPASAFPGPKFSLGWIRVHAACLANFLQAVERGENGNPGLDQGVYIQYLMDQVRQANQTGSRVECRCRHELLSRH
ncbi:MAG: Gfo/Idh/MocA family oxidoreductase [Candidatus Hydrogenedentes bacterium]|nr:Gfo/Idh/MocA family oxidoreductase [Candidatus Hydrogenedentota bacterium]